MARGGSGPIRNRNSRRSDPYERPKVPPKGDSDAPWQHDLFSPLSSLYNPEPTNYKGSLQWPHENKGPSRPQVNPSYRPFGSLERNAAAAASQPIQRPTVEQVQEIQRTNMSLKDRVKSVSLLDRLGSNGARARPSSSSASSRPPREQPDLFSRQTKPQERPGSSRMRSESSMDVDMQPATAAPSAPAPPRGTKVTVANLVDGTTAEDVRTALNSFGPILECSISERNHQGLLTASLVFQEQPHAQAAVDQLHGALADGQTLQVRIVRPDPPTAPRAVRGQASRQGSGKSRSSEQPAQVSSQPQQTKELFPTEGRMHSDLILKYDPRASVQSAPKIYNVPKNEVGYEDSSRRNGDGGGRPRRGRGGVNRRPDGPPSRTPAGANSLSARVQQKPAPSNSGSLAARLGM